MEFVAAKRDALLLRLSYSYLGWVEVGVEFALNGEPGAGGRVGDETDDGLVRGKRASAPVAGDPREETVFDLVPLAGAGWVVADDDLQTGCGGQSGEFVFPQPWSVPVGTTAIRCNHQSVCVGVFFVSHLVPPFFDGGHGEY